jgi:inorganic pyrophosphatase/exopolyphosphatase
VGGSVSFVQQLFLLQFSEKEEEFAVLLYVGVVAHCLLFRVESIVLLYAN